MYGFQREVGRFIEYLFGSSYSIRNDVCER
jgi:hypothetical protein